MNEYLESFVKEKFKKPGKSLDLGAGEFFDIKSLEELGWQCEGVDKLTGVDLEELYKSLKGPFDLVYSNYVLHKIENKEVFFETVFNNLKKGGWMFIHTFDKTDKNSKSGIDIRTVMTIIKNQGFIDIESKIIDFYDDSPDHNHWHKILEITAKKK